MDLTMTKLLEVAEGLEELKATLVTITGEEEIYSNNSGILGKIDVVNDVIFNYSIFKNDAKDTGAMEDFVGILLSKNLTTEDKAKKMLGVK